MVEKAAYSLQESLLKDNIKSSTSPKKTFPQANQFRIYVYMFLTLLIKGAGNYLSAHSHLPETILTILTWDGSGMQGVLYGLTNPNPMGNFELLSDLIAEDLMERRLAELRDRLYHAESLSQEREGDIHVLRSQLNILLTSHTHENG